jgi:hypothetical protein
MDIIWTLTKGIFIYCYRVFSTLVTEMTGVRKFGISKDSWRSSNIFTEIAHLTSSISDNDAILRVLRDICENVYILMSVG